MTKYLALICTEHPEVKKKVDGIGDVISDTDCNALEGMTFSRDDLMYCPIILCQEGSPKYEKLKKNAWKDESGRKYDVIKEYANIADDIVTHVVVEPQEFMKKLIYSETYHFSQNPGIFQSIIDLARNPDSVKLQDLVYLKICIYGNEHPVSDETSRTLDRMLENTLNVIQSISPGK